MGYISLWFAVLIAAALCFYYYAEKKQWIVILCANIIFYLSFDIRYAVYILFNIISTFLCALFLHHTRNKKISRNSMLFLYIVVNVFIWFIVKSSDWTNSVLNECFRMLDMHDRFIIPNFIVPIGISYYTLQSIAYVTDVYRGTILPERDLLKYTTFITYFPAIVQGPISRYRALSRELFHKRHRFDYDRFCMGLQLILYGLIKKLVIADNISVFVNRVYTNLWRYEGFTLYVAMIAYSIQLYMDFSGCVDICRGVSALFDVHLVHNFDKPYFSMSIKEFWQRWHISLSSWLRDYVYIPLGGNRKGVFRKYRNILVTFLVSGIWHGTGSTFLVWGLLHGWYQIIGEWSEPVRRKVKRWLHVVDGSASEKIYRILITFHLVAFAWIFFRASDMAEAWDYITKMMTFNPWVLTDGSLFAIGISYHMMTFLVINIIVIFYIEYRQLKGVHFREAIARQHIGIRWFLYFLMIYDVLILGAYGADFSASAFLYGGF